jgi:hypothetical protein
LDPKIGQLAAIDASKAGSSHRVVNSGVPVASDGDIQGEPGGQPSTVARPPCRPLPRPPIRALLAGRDLHQHQAEEAGTEASPPYNGTDLSHAGGTRWLG